MNILITGSSGMLGTALCRALLSGDNKLAGLDLTKPLPGMPAPDHFVKCDITDYKTLARAVKDTAPEFIIHTAAFTDVDGCEREPDKAETVNGLGTRYVAEAASEVNAVMIYISTDFVFDGRKKSPYVEEDAPNPINVYGKSKLDGEKFVEDLIKREFFIVRTSWMFGSGGKNFVDTILKKADEKKPIRMISDQFGSPTYAADLADAIKRILYLYKKKKEISGIYHITNSDNCSWYRLAQKTLELANIYDIDLVPIVSEELDRSAERPVMSILDNHRYSRLCGRPLRNWERALAEYIRLRKRDTK